MPSKLNKYFRTLELPDNSSMDVVKRKHRTLVKKYHPDKNPNNPAAYEKFLKIQHAFEILISKKLINIEEKPKTSEKENIAKEKDHFKNRHKSNKGKGYTNAKPTDIFMDLNNLTYIIRLTAFSCVICVVFIYPKFKGK